MLRSLPRISGIHPVRSEDLGDLPLPALDSREVALAGPSFKFLTSEQVLAQPSPRWLVREILPQAGLILLWGQPGTGKSFLALDFGLRLVGATDWLGRRIPANGTVAYIAAEGGGGMKQRLAAWTKVNGAIQRTDKNHDLLVLPAAVIFLEPAQLEAILRALAEIKNLVLVIIDTVARSMGPGDENSAKDMGLLISGCNQVQRATDASVLLVHHGGRDGQHERGSTALLGAVDTSMHVERIDQYSLRLVCDKQKDAEQFLPINIALRKVDLGLTDDGDALSSCVVERSIALPESLLGVGSGALVGSAELDPTQLKIAELLLNQPGSNQGLRFGELLEQVGAQNRELAVALTGLRVRGYVHKEEGKRTNPYTATPKLRTQQAQLVRVGSELVQNQLTPVPPFGSVGSGPLRAGPTNQRGDQADSLLQEADQDLGGRTCDG